MASSVFSDGQCVLTCDQHIHNMIYCLECLFFKKTPFIFFCNISRIIPGGYFLCLLRYAVVAAI